MLQKDAGDNFDPVPVESTVREFPDDPLQKYGVKRTIIEEVSRGFYETLGSELIVNDEKLVKSLADIVRSDPNLIKQMKEFITNSKKGYGDSPKITAANAITILVAGNIPFIEEDLQDIRIPFANIRDGIFANCDFQGANLSYVNMKNCKVQGSNFKKANMRDVDLGVYQTIDCNHIVTGLKLSPLTSDGQYLLMSMHKNSMKVIIWNYHTHEKVEDHDGQVGAFSPIGPLHAIGHSHEIKIWTRLEKKNFKLLRTLKGHKENVTTIEFTHDGLELISGSLDKTIILWEVNSGQNVKIYENHTGHITSIAYCPQFSLIVSASDDKTIILWEKDTGKIKKIIHDHTHPVNFVGFFRNAGNFITASDDNKSPIKAWQTKDGYFVENFDGFHANGVKSLALSPSGNLFVSVSKEKILVLNHSTRNVISDIPIHNETNIFSVIFGPDDSRIISGGDDKKITFHDCTLARSRKIYEGPSNVISSLVFSPDGSCLASGGNDKTVRLWSSYNGKLLKVLQSHTNNVTSVQFSPEGTHVLSGSLDKSCIIWSKNSGNVIEIIKVEEDVHSVAYSPNGKHFICAAGKKLKLYNISPKKLMKTFEGHSEIVTCVAFGSDEIISGSSDKSVILWNMHGDHIRTFNGHSSKINAIAFSPDFSKFVSAGNDHKIIVWDKESTDPLSEKSNAHNFEINALSYSPNGLEIISGSHDNKVKIWSESDLDQIKMLEAHTSPVVAVGYSPDGNTIYTAGLDNAIRLWQRTTQSKHSNSDFVLVLEITTDETQMKCSGMVLNDMVELSEFNESIFVEHGAKAHFL